MGGSARRIFSSTPRTSSATIRPRTGSTGTKGASGPDDPPQIWDPSYSTSNNPGPLGTIFITTGGGGRPLSNPGSKGWIARSRKLFHVVRVEVSGLSLQIDMIDENGDSQDTIVLTKPEYKFLRGDVNQDWDVDMTDGINIAHFLFVGDYYGDACLDAFDANDDGSLDISDAPYVLNYLFSGGPPPPAPFAEPPYPYDESDCGPDPTGDALDCERFVPAEIPGDWQSGWAL